MKLFGILALTILLTSCSTDKMLGKHSNSEELDPFSSFSSVTKSRQCPGRIVNETVTQAVTGCPSPGPAEQILVIEPISVRQGIRIKLKNGASTHPLSVVSGVYISDDAWGYRERKLECNLEKTEGYYDCKLQKLPDDFGGFFKFDHLVVRRDCGSESRYAPILPAGCDPRFTPDSIKIGDRTVPGL